VAGERDDTVILVDPDIREVGIDRDAFVTALRCQENRRTMLVPGLASHPELLTAAVKTSGAVKAVVVAAKLGRPPIAELRTWGVAGGLSPLKIQTVSLDILHARRGPTERSTYAVRMVRAALAALDTPGTAKAARRPVVSLSRRSLLSGRSTTWVPVIEVDTRTCRGTVRCQRCVEACPWDALEIPQDVLGGPPVVDASRCRACSGCLDVCPPSALRLDGHSVEGVARRLNALLQSDDGAAAPAMVIACRTVVEPLHRLGERGGLPGWLVLELACLGGVGSAWYLAALAGGARTVQILPCEGCRDRASLTKDLHFTRKLLAALGDAEAAQRVAVLPGEGSRLQRAILAAERLSALVDSNVAEMIPTDGIKTAAPVAAWAVGKLQRALAGPAQGRQDRGRVIQGGGAPLGVPRTGEGCTACGVCTRNCPAGALTLSHGVGSTDLVLDPAACTGCRVCVQTCPESVLDVDLGVDLDLLAGGCVPIARITSAVCPDCGESVPSLPATAQMTSLPAELASRCPRCRQAVLVASV